MSAKVEVERREAVGIIRLNSPETANAMDPDLGRGLAAALEELAGDPNVRALVLTATGRAFSAGANVRAIKAELDPAAGMTPDRVLARFVEIFAASGLLMAEMGKPVVAAVNGPAAGGGLALALAADVVVASTNAVFDPVYVRLGLVPVGGLSVLLPALLGPKKAAEFLFLARPVDAEEAVRLGLINRVAPPERFLDEALEMAARMAAQPPLALARTKELLRRARPEDLAEAFKRERQALEECGQSPEHRAMLDALIASLNR